MLLMLVMACRKRKDFLNLLWNGSHCCETMSLTPLCMRPQQWLRHTAATPSHCCDSVTLLWLCHIAVTLSQCCDCHSAVTLLHFSRVWNISVAKSCAPKMLRHPSNFSNCLLIAAETAATSASFALCGKGKFANLIILLYYSYSILW